MKMDKNTKEELRALLDWTRQKLEVATCSGDSVQAATWQGRITGIYDVLDVINGYNNKNILVKNQK